MEKKELIEVEAPHLIKVEAPQLFGPQMDSSKTTSLHFQFLENKRIKLCSEYSADGYFSNVGLTELIIPDAVLINGDEYRITQIEQYVLSMGFQSIRIPKSVEEIDVPKCHFYNSALKSIVVSKDNKYYDSRDGCNAIIETRSNKLIYALSNSFIPNTIKIIGANSFEHCSIESIFIPNLVVEIEDDAFRLCINLASVTIPSSVEIIGVNPFGCCINLSSITVSEDNKYFDSRNNCNAIIVTKENALLSSCCNTVIPDTIDVIKERAFESNHKETLTIPSSVRRIDSFAFIDSRLKKVKIEGSLIQISRGCFMCSGLLEIKLPEQLESIGNQAFEMCHKLKSVSFPSSLRHIGFRAFANCKSLKYVTIVNKNAEIHKAAFDNNIIINGKPLDYWYPEEGKYLNLQKQ